MVSLEAQLNDFLGKLVEDGCYDLAGQLLAILEEHDLVQPEYDDDSPDVDQER